MTTSLTTRAAFKEYLQITNTTDDALIDRLVLAVSELVAQVLQRDVGAIVSFTEIYDGSGNIRQVLRNYPVVAVSAVSINGQAQTSAGSSVTATGYRFDRYGLILNGNVFPIGIQNITVTYTAGNAAVPADVAQAALETMAWVYRARNRAGETSKAIQGGQTSYSEKDIPPTAMRILNNYQRRSPI